MKEVNNTNSCAVPGKKCDIDDTLKILAALKEWNSFSQDLTLHTCSIVNDITADDNQYSKGRRCWVSYH